MFELLPLAEDNKKICKCKKCGAAYMCDSSHATGKKETYFELL